MGFARKADGSTGVAALFGFLVYRAVTWTMSPIIMGKPEPLNQEALDCLHSFDPAKGEIAQVGPWNQGVKLCDIPTQTPINYGVLGGIVIGVVAALFWQRYYRVKLPDWLAFFGGRRFVPIITSGAALVIALVMSALYPAFNWLINEQLGGWLINAGNSKGLAGALAVFVFGTVNRLLIPSACTTSSTPCPGSSSDPARRPQAVPRTATSPASSRAWTARTRGPEAS